MAVLTKYLGEVEIAESNIIHFPTGLPGFVDEMQFALLDLPGNPSFQILQSISTPDLAFIVTDPYHFYREYEFNLDENIQSNLEIDSERDVTVRTIVTLKDPFKTSTLNLKAPLIINQTKNKGKQYILNTDEYLTKAPILPSITSEAKGE